ncbi:MAG: endo-1,4-beta-xylanase, partial [Lewinella sp.]
MHSFLRNRLLAALLACALFAPLVSHAQNGLRDWAGPKQVFIGNIISNALLDNPGGYEGGRALTNLRTEYNVVTLENYMKMNAVLPAAEPGNIHNLSVAQLRNTLRTGQIDRFLNGASFSGFRKRGHAMIWYSQAPTWLNNNAPNWTAQQVFDFSRKYILALGQVCGNGIDEWDVLNEAISDEGTARWRTGTWYRQAGNGSSTTYGPATYENYFRMLFVWAREAQPNARLFYNDYAVETFNASPTSKNGFLRTRFAELKNCGAPIDGIGFQSHFIASQMITAQGAVNAGFINAVQASMQDLDNAGLEVAITELDIRICNGDRSEASLEPAYYEFVRMAYGEPNCRELLLWGQHDEVSWITLSNSGTFGPCRDPLIFDNSFYAPKAAYNGVRGAIQSQPNRSSYGYPPLNPGAGVAGNCNGGNGGGGAAINTVVASDDAVRNTDNTVTVNYTATGNQDIVVYFQLDSDPYTVFREVRQAVTAGTRNLNLSVNVPAAVPVANNAYQYQVLLTPRGGGYDNRLANQALTDVDVVASGPASLDNRVFLFRNVATGLYLDSDGTPVICGQGNVGQDKQWRLVPTDNGFYNIDNVFEGRGVIDSDPGGVIFCNTGTAPDTGDDKEWRAVPLGNNRYRFECRIGNRGNLYNNADNTAGYAAGTDTRAQWELVPVAGANLNAPAPAAAVRQPLLTQDLHGLAVYPNPTTAELYLDGVPKGRYTVTIYDATGRRMLQRDRLLSGPTRIDIAGVPAGLYI